MEGPERERGPADSGPRFATLTLDRRRFLVLLGGAAAATALAPSLGWTERLDRPALQTWGLPGMPPEQAHERVRSLIGAAILAPSHWNSQPWRFEVEGEELRLTLDPTRTLPVGDPDQRFAHLSLGAALENLLVAARAWGLQPTVQHLPWGLAQRPGAPLVAASVRWQRTEHRRDRLLFGALTERRSNPRGYDGRAITSQSRAQLMAQGFEDVHLHWLDDRAAIARVAEIAAEAARESGRDARLQEDQRRWLRTDDGDVRRRGDGVAIERLGIDGLTRWFAGRAHRPGAWLHGWAAGQVAGEVRDRVRSSGGLALLTARGGSGPARWLLAGQSYERFALKATSLGIAHHPLSGPVQLPSAREALRGQFGAAAGDEPLLVVRLGHARPVSPTARRAAALVSSYRVS